MNAPLPEDEDVRLSALYAHRLLDTAPDEAYDDITRLAALICRTPMAVLSLVDADRVSFKSVVGVEMREIPRAAAFCAHTILCPDLFVVPDAAWDERFQDNPFVVGAPHLRFYAGAPITAADGHALGALCVADPMPRQITPDQEEALRLLARHAADRIRRTRAEAAQRLGDAKFRRLVDSGVVGINLWDMDGRITWVNDRFLAMTGHTRADVDAGRLRWDDLTPPEWEAATAEATRQIRERGTFEAYEKEFFRRDGTRVPVLLGGALLDHGTEGISFILDLTDQKRAAEARRQGEETIRLLAGGIANAVEGITIADARLPDQPLVYCNPAFSALTGYPEHEAIGRNCRFLQGEGTDPAARRQVREAIREGRACRVTLLNYRKDGTPFWNELNIAPMHDDQGALTHFVGIQHDVTDLRQAEQQIRDDNLVLEVQKAQLEAANADLAELATADPLTGLLNHRAFQTRMRRDDGAECVPGAVPAVAVLNLDDFRFFNDVYGPAAGDAVLRMVAARLREVCGGRDAAARFGGDEFTLLLSDVGRSTVEEVEARLAAAVTDLSFRPPGAAPSIPITLTLGVALLSGGGQGRQEAMRQATERLRWAKTGGGGDTDAGRLRTAMLSRVEGFSMLDALVTAVDNKDRYTRRHSEDVMAHAARIAAALGLDGQARDAVAVAALLHDVGKIGVPDHILRKPGRLTDAEFAAVQQHPQMGAIIVGAVPGFESALDAVRHHHERWDGGGYPFGLRGGEIPPMARLMAVADAYSAMTMDRPYRRGMTDAEARAILEGGAGTQWDPECVRAFLASRA